MHANTKHPKVTNASSEQKLKQMFLAALTSNPPEL